jgi:hypothetical protein
MIRRRAFITLLGGAAAAWPLAARAQQPAERTRRIGVLMSLADTDPEAQARVAAFRKGLQTLGWAEGRNVRIDIRWAASDAALMQRFAKELIALQPDLILSHNTPTTASLLQQTRTIPIVFVIVSDPVGSGFVASFPRPGGNVTGFTNIEPTMAGKWLELLKEIAPSVARVALLFNPATTPYAEYYLGPLKAAAAFFAVEAIATPVRDAPGLESVVAAHAREPNSGSGGGRPHVNVNISIATPRFGPLKLCRSRSNSTPWGGRCLCRRCGSCADRHGVEISSRLHSMRCRVSEKSLNPDATRNSFQWAAGRGPALTNLIASLARTASPTNSLALIEIGEALSASDRTLARVFTCASRIAGAITFVPFTCVGGSDRNERHS